MIKLLMFALTVVIAIYVSICGVISMNRVHVFFFFFFVFLKVKFKSGIKVIR